MPVADILAKVVQGAAGAAGDSDAQAQVGQWQQQRQQQRQDQQKMALAPLSEALQADQTRLALFANPDDPSKPLAGKEDQYNATIERMRQTIGQMRGIVGEKPAGANPVEAGMGNLLDKLHITNHLKNHVAQVRAQNAAKYAGQTNAMVSAETAGALPYAMTPEGRKAAEAYRLQELKNQGMAGRASNSRPVPYYAGAVNLKTASAMTDQGVQFNGEDGNPIDLSTLPEGSILIPVYLGGGKSYWSIGTDKGRYESAGNQRLLEPSVGGPNPEAPSLGPVRVPTSTTRTQTSPGGKQVVTGTSEVVPQNSQPGATAAPGPTLHTRPQGTVTRGLQGRADIERGKGILPDIQNMTPQNAAAARKAQPAVTALLGLYGDPQNPQTPSMVDFAPLANDQHAQQVLGEAFKLLDQSMGEISDPGIIQTLGTAAGWANFRAQAEAGAQQATGTQMTSKEREYFDTAIASMADIIGSRSATGQSPARFSVKSIQNELPLIGLSGTPDETSYLTKMQTIGRQVRIGLNGLPDNSRALAWLDKREAAIAKQKEGKSAKGKAIVQHSPSTGQYRYSMDGGKTWQPGKPPSQ